MNEKYSNIDDLYRDKFKDFELYPPDHVWENIKKEIGHPNPGKGGQSLSKGGIIGITILLVLISSLTFYFLQSTVGRDPGNEINTIEQSGYHLNKSVPRTVKTENLRKNEKSDPIAKNSGSEKNQNLPARFDLDQGATLPSGKTSLSVDDHIIVTESEIDQYQPEQDRNEAPVDKVVTISEFDNKPGSDDYFTEEKTNKEVSEQYILENENENSAEPALIKTSDYGRKGNWGVGLFFSPEMIFYPSSSEFNSRSYSFDLHAIYSLSGFILQSGIGVGLSSDNGNYMIDYNRYLGSYDDVYDITFDTINGVLIPVYHTESVEVYDTIDHITITPTKRKYTYLNIPLLVGYGYEGKRFGWSIKTGPSISILINENVPDIGLGDSQNKILGIEDELPGRLKTNWQFVLTGGASYKLSNSFNFMLEPVFRYYINSAYEQNNTISKRPYSFGIRAGLVLGF